MRRIHTLKEAEKHNADYPALVEVPGHLVRPIIIFRDECANFQQTGVAEMARGIEILLIGLANMESSMLDLGVSQAIIAAAMLTRSPEEVLDEVIEEEKANIDPNPEGLRLIPGGLSGPIPMGEDDEDPE